ncbi:MAG: nucleoside 2-deoxyribosyltransferase [Planctomycetales bacterium]
MPRNSAAAAHRVYCAGPLFNGAERDEMTAIADELCAAGFLVYLPHRDGMEFRLVHEVLVARGWDAPTAAHFLHASIFALDIHQLVVECDSVVWNLNGRTPDEGAVSEAAIAWTLGKPLVAYRDDVRTLIAGRVNPLLVGLVDFETVETIPAIPQALKRAIAETNDGWPGLEQREAPVMFPSRPAPATLPSRVIKAAADGERLWQAMRIADAQSDNEAIADLVEELFAPDRAASNGRKQRTVHRGAAGSVRY